MKLISFLIFLVSVQTFGMSNAQLNGKFCSENRVTEYKEIIKSHYKKISECLEKSDYIKCKKKFKIGFPVSQRDKQTCYIFPRNKRKEKESCLKLFREGKIAEAELIFFNILGKPNFSKADIFIGQKLNCSALVSDSIVSGKLYKGQKDSNHLYTGSLTIHLTRSSQEPDLGLSYTPTIIFKHEDKNPGEYKNWLFSVSSGKQCA